MRIAVSSLSFRRPLAAGELTQLEWIERCASVLGADGVVADIVDFPRTDAEYVAQLRKVAVDLSIVPFGVDASALLGLDAGGAVAEVLGVAAAFGALVARTQLPPPGAVPPATFHDAVAAAQRACRAAKAANVTLLVRTVPGTLGDDVGAVKHLLKDVDSAWLRVSPTEAEAGALAPKDRVPAFRATTRDAAGAVAAAAGRSWVILDAPDAARPWDELQAAIAALRAASAESRRA